MSQWAWPLASIDSEHTQKTGFFFFITKNEEKKKKNAEYPRKKEKMNWIDVQ